MEEFNVKVESNELSRIVLRREEDVISSLKKIEVDSKQIGMTIRKESHVYNLELEDRLRKGLTGQAAIDHYNDWMQRYDMPHLMV